MTIPKDNSQLKNARQLRREMTPHERKLWYLFLRKFPVKIYKQRIIGRFIVDFYCASARLVIEIDGSQHYEAQGIAYDSERSAYLEGLGLMVLRFSNRDIDRDFHGVCEQIDSTIQKRLHDPLSHLRRQFSQRESQGYLQLHKKRSVSASIRSVNRFMRHRTIGGVFFREIHK